MAEQAVTASAGSKKMTKSQVVAAIAEKLGLPKKAVAEDFGAMNELVKHELGKKGPGEFVVPDLLERKLRAVPATPKRLTPKGYGMEPPLAPNLTPAARAKNRRVEFKILERARE